jgi:putative ABC transport system permease protein
VKRGTGFERVFFNVSQLRYALRTVIKTPGPTLVMVMTLGLAVGAATVIYSLIDVVWHFVPAPNQTRLAFVASTDTRVVQSEGDTRSVVLRTPTSVPDLTDWAARSTAFEQLAGFTIGSASLTGVKVPQRVTAIGVTANLPEMWGLRPALGRTFRAEEGRTGSTGVTLLSHAFWEREFSASPDAVGQTVLLDEVPHAIVGVLPRDAGTGFFTNADVFRPFALDTLRAPRNQRDVLVTGRLKPGITRQQADAELQTIARQLGTEYPATNQTIGAVVLPLIEASGFNVRILLTILGLIGLLVVVVACANVASVMVAQSLSRRHELAVHAALGATRADRLRQLVVEGLIVSLAAGVVGLLVAAWGMVGLRWLGSSTFAFVDIQMNGRVLLAGLLIACATPVGFSVLPALRMAPPDPQELRDGARAAGATRRGRRVRNLIVGLQAAAAIILMVQIGLFLRTTWRLSDVAPGFEPAQVLTFRVALPASRYPQPRAIDRFVADLLMRLHALPGVAAAGTIDRLPIADSETMARLTVEGAVAEPIETRPLVARSAIAGEFLTALRVPLRRGRVITDTESTDAAAVAMITEEAARRHWSGRDPIGSRFALDAVGGQEMWLEVVGVVGNLRNSDGDQAPLPQVFIASSRQPSNDIAVVVKTVDTDPLSLVPAIRGQVAAIDPNQPIHDVSTMAKVLYDDLATTYVLSAILSTIGLVALLLSAAGVYGLVSYSVAQRRREIGLRMALGARPDGIVRMIVVQSTRPVALGGLIGLVLAAAIALLLASGLPEFDARDPVNYAGVVVMIGLAALLASVIPARRAASVNPVDALRAD